MVYFDKEIYVDVRREVEGLGGSGADSSMGSDLLKNELISDSTALLFLLLRLDLFHVLQYSFPKAREARTIYAELLKIMLYIFQYEKFELRFVKAHV
jgi:hypothetical protein